MRQFGFVIVCISMLLGGCGFHMRGDWQLPASMQDTLLLGGTSFLEEQLQREFRAASANLSRKNESTAGARLTISLDQMDKRVLTVDNRGRVIEFEIYYVLSFDLKDKSGKQIMPLQKINMTRDYPFSATNVLGASQEEALLREEMYRTMARQMMRRIQARVR